MGPLFNSGHGMYTATLTKTVNIPGYVEPSDTNTMVVFPDKSSIPADGSPINVNVRAGGAYTVTPSEDWVHYQKYEHGIMLSADPNIENGSRTFDVVIKLIADTSQTVTLKMSQSSITESGFCVSPGLAVAPAFGSHSQLVQLHATGSWQAAALNDWIVVYNSSNEIQYVGYNSTDFFVKVKPNYTGQERKGYVRFSGNGEAMYTVMQNPAMFSMSMESLTFTAAGGTQKIELKPILSDTLPVINVKPEGSGFNASYANGIVTVTADPNTASTPREGHIDITPQEGEPAVVYVTQLGA